MESPDVGYLKVSFFGPFYGSYIVMDTDYKTYAMISGPDHSYFWILARTPILDKKTVSRLVEKAQKSGFDTDKLIFVDQGEKMTDNVLLIVAHGSRKEASNAEVKALVEKIEKLVEQRYEIVKPAFLEFTEPSIEGEIVKCIQAGAQKITLFPYFLAPGHHVTHDIPDLIQTMQKRYPKVNFSLKPYLGSTPEMASVISEMV